MKFIPTYYFKNIYEIEPSFYIRNNFKYVLFDLDNTLDSPYDKNMNRNTNDYLLSLIKNNIVPIIISNNSENRVKSYVGSLKIIYLARALKPFTRKISNFLVKNNINKSRCVMVGDQIFTDIKCSKKLKIESILLEPLQKKDKPITFINRLLDKHYRNKLIKSSKIKLGDNNGNSK